MSDNQNICTCNIYDIDFNDGKIKISPSCPQHGHLSVDYAPIDDKNVVVLNKNAG
jgi:hypothetical protein